MSAQELNKGIAQTITLPTTSIVLPIENVASNKSDASNTGWSITNYVSVGLLVVFLVLVCYYAYVKFNIKEKDTMRSDKKSKSADDEIDPNFNLQNEIKELENTQKDILKDLSQNVDL